MGGTNSPTLIGGAGTTRLGVEPPRNEDHAPSLAALRPKAYASDAPVKSVPKLLARIPAAALFAPCRANFPRNVKSVASVVYPHASRAALFLIVATSSAV